MEENKSNLMAKIALRLEKIKELMQGKGFTHFYIPDQFNYDASVDDFFEEEIRDDEKTVFAGYRENAYVAELRYTIDGIYLENGELSFDLGYHSYFVIDEYSDYNTPAELDSWVFPAVENHKQHHRCKGQNTAEEHRNILCQ